MKNKKLFTIGTIGILIIIGIFILGKDGFGDKNPIETAGTKEASSDEFNEFYNYIWQTYDYIRLQDFNKDKVDIKTLQAIQSNISAFKMEIENTEHYGDKNLEEFKNQLLEIADYVNLKANSYEEYLEKQKQSDLETYTMAIENIEQKEKEMIVKRDELINKYDLELDEKGFIK